MLKWLKSFAEERGLAWQQDTVGNLVIKRTGTGGGEEAPAVVIQVCSLPPTAHHVLRFPAGMMAASDVHGVAHMQRGAMLCGSGMSKGPCCPLLGL